MQERKKTKKFVSDFYHGIFLLMSRLTPFIFSFHHGVESFPMKYTFYVRAAFQFELIQKVLNDGDEWADSIDYINDRHKNENDFLLSLLSDSYNDIVDDDDDGDQWAINAYWVRIKYAELKTIKWKWDQYSSVS